MVASYIFNIAAAIFLFPQHPRLWLAMIIFYVAFLIWFALMIYVEAAEKRFNRKIDLLWEALDVHRDVFRKLLDTIQALDSRQTERAVFIAESLHKYIKEMEPIHQEANAANTAAIRAIHNTVVALNDKVNLLKEPPSDSDKEPD
jgi:hypothetical protein